MQGSKNLAVMFLLGAVLVGGALGFTADRVIIRDQLCAKKPRLTLADRLQLNESQRARLDSIVDHRRSQYDLVMATVREQMDSVRLRSREQIRAILTAEQRQEFEKLLTELNQPNQPGKGGREDN